MARLAALLFACSLVALPAAADTGELPPRLADLAGARSEAMGGAFRAVGTSNDTLMLNPAGLGAASRYEVNGLGSYDLGRAGGTYGANIADSMDGPFAGGLSYTRFYQGPPGPWTVANDFRLALALPIGPNLTIGLTGKWIYMSSLRRHDAVTPDAGAMLRLDLVTVALVAYNLVDVSSKELPRQFAAAVAVGPDSTWKVAFDVVADTASRPEPSFAFQAGGEFLPLNYLAVRAGYDEDRIRLARFLAGGVGVQFPVGVGADLTYRHQLNGAVPSRELLLTVKVLPFAGADQEATQNYLDQ